MANHERACGKAPRSALVNPQDWMNFVSLLVPPGSGERWTRRNPQSHFRGGLVGWYAVGGNWFDQLCLQRAPKAKAAGAAEAGPASNDISSLSRKRCFFREPWTLKINTE